MRDPRLTMLVWTIPAFIALLAAAEVSESPGTGEGLPVLAPPALQEAPALEPLAYSGNEDVRALWWAGEGGAPPYLAQTEQGAFVALTCAAFGEAAPKAPVRWRRPVDPGRANFAAVSFDLYCEDSSAIDSLQVSLTDIDGAPIACAVREPAVGRNEGLLTASDLCGDADWADVAQVEVAVVPTRAGAKILAGEVRMLQADERASFARPTHFDCIELHDGRVLAGSIQNGNYILTTRFGRVTLPANEVVGITAIAEAGAAVRVFLTNGEVLQGMPAEEELRILDGEGNVQRILLEDMRSCAYQVSRVRPLVPEPARPMMLIAGNRVAYRIDEAAWSLETPHGALDLPIPHLRRLEADSQQPGVFRATLDNGSIITGRLSPASFQARLEHFGWASIETGQVSALRWPGDIREPHAVDAVQLRGGDRIFGRVRAGSLTIKLEFGPETVDWASIRTLALDPVDIGAVRAELWGGRVLQGRLLDESLPIQLALPTEPGAPTWTLAMTEVRSITAASVRPSATTARAVDRALLRTVAPDTTARSQAVAELKQLEGPALDYLRQRLGQVSPAIRAEANAAGLGRDEAE